MRTLLNPIGVYAPNTRLKKTSSYILSINDKIVLLDCGIGTGKEFINYILKSNIKMEDIIIVISHNHIDHIGGLFTIGDFLRRLYPCKKITIFMSNTSDIYYNWYKSIVSKYSDVFNIIQLNSNTTFYFGNAKFTFCKTNHCEGKIKSYATKVSMYNKNFVYTSDIVSVNDTLNIFVKNADLVLVEAGNPVKRLKTLPGYHGLTNDNVSALFASGVKNIYLTHLKGCFDENLYIQSILPINRSNVKVVKEGEPFDIYTGSITETLYNKEIFPLLA